MRVSRFAEKKSRFFFQMFFARVSECVSIPAGMREQMNFCLCIFYRIFYPFKRDKRDKCENSRGWSVSLCLALSRLSRLRVGVRLMLKRLDRPDPDRPDASPG